MKLFRNKKMTLIDPSLRNEILDSLKKRNATEIGLHYQLIKSRE